MRQFRSGAQFRQPVMQTGRRDRETAFLASTAQLSSTLVAGRDPLGRICGEHLSTGGGQFRARLVLSAADALGVHEDCAVGWAAACELMHNATLIHDDLQDRDPLRRGRPTVWKRHGEAQAINAGDLLLTLPYRAVEHIPIEPGLRWQLTKTIAERAEETVRGQSLEMTLLERRPWNRQDYDAAATGKTGALLALPVEGMALVAGIAPEHARAIGDAFRDLGLVYQFQDDVLDLYGDKLRERGTDILEGKVTALVVEHVRLHPEEHDWLFEVLACPASSTTPDDVDALASRFERGGALSAVVERAAEHAAEIVTRPLFHTQPQLLVSAECLSARCLKPLECLMQASHSREHANVN